MKDGERADPIPTPMDQRFQDFRTRVLPTVVWVAAIVAASVMMTEISASSFRSILTRSQIL